ncbi:MAG: glycosyltransferase family 2 protein [Holophagales bacterium]|nr:MAG: glycosyltransferase family 2 protein [Holophagales bacterium]
MNIVIPMAGRGQRFVDAGYAVPKPMIPVLGRPMYSWAVESLPLELASRLIFVCLAEHLEGHGLAEDIAARYRRFGPVVRGLEAVTRGQVCTVLTARDLLDPSQPLLIYNADTWCRTRLGERLPALPAEVDGLLGVFEAPGDHWSFARTDANGRVVETAEKRRISPWASTGLYHFSRTGDFLRHADAMIAAEDTTRGEFYVAPLYNRMLREGADLRLDVAEEVRVLGTPAELAAFERSAEGWAAS